MVVLRGQLTNPAPTLEAALRGYHGLNRSAAPGPARRRQTRRLRRLTARDVQQAINRYQAGESMIQIARGLGVRRDTVSAAFGKAGLPTRIMHVPATTDVDRAVELYAQGWSTRRTGEHLGFDAETIRKYLKERGVQMRPAGRRPGSATSLPAD